MDVPIVQVDAFTDVPFAGNPAAVCLLSAPREVSWMQQVALEMNLSETAFLCRRDDGFELRWFTPAMEVDLCGHATLASAHVLWEEGLLAVGETARFYTHSGLLTATHQDDWIELDFPSRPAEAVEAPPALLRALKVAPLYVGKNTAQYLVEVASEEIVRQLEPDFALLKTLPVQGTIVTCRATSGQFDCVSRYFAPRAGINEDPVTGSAHCCLAPFWGQQLGKTALLAYQASRRGGVLRLQWHGNRVSISGRAVTVLRGKLLA